MNDNLVKAMILQHKTNHPKFKSVHLMTQLQTKNKTGGDA